jgi:hypothetical protein
MMADGIDEAHVQHAVGFVQHQGVEAVDLEGALGQVFLNAAGRADHHVGAVLQRADLRAEGHAAAQGQHLDVVGGTGQAADFLGHLVGQLAGGAEHQGLAAEVARVERVQEADAEGGGLAAAGLGLGDQVLPLQDQRQALGLDRRHGGVAQLVEVGEHGGGKRQGIESGGHDGGLKTAERRAV